MPQKPFDPLAPPPRRAPLLKRPLTWMVLTLVLAGVGGALFWTQTGEQPARVDVPQTSEPPPQAPPAAGPEPQIRYPLPEPGPRPEAAAKPLPLLNDSDDLIRVSLASSIANQTFGDIVIGKDVARRIVATIDNLPRQTVATRLLPVKSPPGQFAAIGEGDVMLLSPANYARYGSYVRLARAIDVKKLVAVYVHFYPLFQQAYEELGYPTQYFNDRLVEVIDDLLATPDVQEPVKLMRPKVMYEFADAELEDLSAGQKILVRIGRENAASIKAKLREIRSELTTAGPAQRR